MTQDLRRTQQRDIIDIMTAAEWSGRESNVTLESVDARLEAVLRELAALSTRIGHLEVKAEAASAASQRADISARAAVNATVELRRHVDRIAAETVILASAATGARAEAEEATRLAGACYEAVDTLTRPYRQTMPTERLPSSHSPPPNEDFESGAPGPGTGTDR